jgi:hypothetical protein
MGKTLAFSRRFDEVERRFVKDPNNPRIKLELDRLWVEFNHYQKTR